MAGHLRFGARTGGALIILGGLELAAALLLGDSIGTLARLFPMPVRGVSSSSAASSSPRRPPATGSRRPSGPGSS
jgi:hypothetical protein